MAPIPGECSLKVLIVEDSPDALETATAIVKRALPDATTTSATNAASAIDALNEQPVDLVICDLKIFADSSTISTHEDYGFAVIEHIRDHRPGTPVVILSAFATYDNTIQRTAESPVAMTFGVNMPMLQVARKGRLEEIEAILARVAGGLALMVAIEVDRPADLDPLLLRAIRQRAVVAGYDKAEVLRAGGLSSASTAIVRFDGPGLPTSRSFFKVDILKWIRKEFDSYQHFVAGTLPVGSYASTEMVATGLGDHAATIASFATDHTSLFEFVQANPDAAEPIVGKISSAITPWEFGSDPNEVTIGDLRRGFISDAEAIALGVPLVEFEAIESRSLSIGMSISHGDLHGENILVSVDARPLLVDFAYTALGPRVADPVTLELSVLFHPSSPLSVSDPVRWLEQSQVEGTAWSEFARRCRAWARERGSDLEISAYAYAHALRHAKHVDIEYCLEIARWFAQAAEMAGDR